MQEAIAAAELEALRRLDPVKYPPPPPVEPEPEPQPEPLPNPMFVIPESMYPEVADAVQLPELYATVPELSAEELAARRKRYRCLSVPLEPSSPFPFLSLCLAGCDMALANSCIIVTSLLLLLLMNGKGYGR